MKAVEEVFTSNDVEEGVLGWAPGLQVTAGNSGLWSAVRAWLQTSRNTEFEKAVKWQVDFVLGKV